jgi:hypothetical protein
MLFAANRMKHRQYGTLYEVWCTAYLIEHEEYGTLHETYFVRHGICEAWSTAQRDNGTASLYIMSLLTYLNINFFAHAKTHIQSLLQSKKEKTISFRACANRLSQIHSDNMKTSFLCSLPLLALATAAAIPDSTVFSLFYRARPYL